jgi:SAM-dependent methyltransferase
MGRPAERSFDLGCGSGGKSLELWQAGLTRWVEGVDISVDRVAAGEQRRQQLGVPGGFCVGDANAVQLAPGAYELIFSSHSFHHFLDLERVFAQVVQALTPTGFFVLEEYIGPTQFQWTDAQLRHTEALLRTLPRRLRLYADGQVKWAEGRPTPAEVAAVSPFEAIRSAEIWPLFQQHFEVITVRPTGGTVQHLLYNGILHNFELGDAEADACLQAICAAEDQLIDSGVLPSDFALLVGRPR